MEDIKETSKEMQYQIYRECEKRWNENHRTSWVDGDMNKRIDLYLEVEKELLSK